MKTNILSFFLALPLLGNAQFFENFDSSISIPSGWTVINGGDTKTWQIISYTGGTISAYSGINTVSIGFDTTAHDDYLITPAITVTAGVNDFFSFYARSRDPLFPEKVSLKISKAMPIAADFTTVLDANVAPPSGASFTKYEYDLSAYVGQTIYIGFHSTTHDMFYFDIDDVMSTAKQECFIPINLNVSDITATSANLSWASSAPAGSTYQVEYGLAGFVHGTGTTVSVAGLTTAMSLSSNTSYDAYVRLVCGSSYSDWSSKFTFKTSCSSITSFPFTEKFDSASLPTCWSNGSVSGGGSAVWTYVTGNGNQSITPKSAPRMAEFRTTTQGNKSKLLTPMLDLSNISNPAVKFSYANVEWFGDVDELRVYYKTNPSDEWVLLGPAYTTQKSTWTDVTLPLPNKSANYMIAFEGTSNWARGINMDDIVIGEQATLAVNDIIKTNINVYPNPVKNILNINADGAIDSIEIYTMTGQLITTIDKKAKQVDMSNLSKGTYLIRIKSEGKDQAFKIIKD